MPFRKIAKTLVLGGARRFLLRPPLPPLAPRACPSSPYPLLPFSTPDTPSAPPPAPCPCVGNSTSLCPPLSLLLFFHRLVSFCHPPLFVSLLHTHVLPHSIFVCLFLCRLLVPTPLFPPTSPMHPVLIIHLASGCTGGGRLIPVGEDSPGVAHCTSRSVLPAKRERGGLPRSPAAPRRVWLQYLVRLSPCCCQYTRE